MHEIGHRYRHNALGVWFFADIFSYLNCMQHYMFSLMSNQHCAWSEGWADYFALIVNSQFSANDWCFDYQDFGPCSQNSHDLENQGCGDANAAMGAVGDFVEGRIAGALWDITDGHDDGWDIHWNSFGAVWTLMYEYTS